MIAKNSLEVMAFQLCKKVLDQKGSLTCDKYAMLSTNDAFYGGILGSDDDSYKSIDSESAANEFVIKCGDPLVAIGSALSWLRDAKKHTEVL